MSVLSFALMQQPCKASPYSVQYEEDEEEEESMYLSGDEDAPHKKQVPRYNTRDAIMNRATFLVVIGLIVVFSICVARDGARDNFEWLRNQLNMDYVSMDKHKTDIMSVSNLVRHDGHTITLLLVLGVQSSPYSPVLSHLRKGFVELGLNTSAVLWVKDSQATSFQTQHSWKLLTMNASTPETLISHLLDDMGVAGVLYMDTDAVSRNLRLGTFSVDLGNLLRNSRALPDELIVTPYKWPSSTGAANTTTTTERNPQDDLLHPPSLPLIDLCILLAWNTPHVVTLFRQAAQWQHSTPSHDSSSSDSTGVNSFILNMLLNDGRHVVSSPDQAPDLDALRVGFYDGWNH